MCLSTSHEGASKDLCASLATVARRICSSYVDPTSVKPLLGILMRVISLLSTNTHECVPLTLVTQPFESLPKLFYPLQPLRSRSRCCTCPERKVLEVAVKATCFVDLADLAVMTPTAMPLLSLELAVLVAKSARETALHY